MRAHRLGIVALVVTSIGLGAAAGCGSSDASTFDDGDAGADGAPVQVTPPFGGGDGATSSGPDGGCATSADCNGGYCNDGVCCASAASACGTGCCADGTACVFDKCIVPGKPCHSANDCAATEYCETALGSGPEDAGAPDASCTAALPIGGRCVPRPARCGDPGAGTDCIPACEYHPPAEAFNVQKKWEWGYDLGPNEYPNHVDVWATPVVGRVYDGNCDGRVDELDAPNIVFVSGDARNKTTGAGDCCQCNGASPTACHSGVLRMIDGKTGKTIWSLATPGGGTPAGYGFAGLSPALADIDGDGRLDILVATGDGFIVVVDDKGNVKRRSDKPVEVDNAENNAVKSVAAFGWGGGLAVADMDGDGFPEVAYGKTVFTTKDGFLTRKFQGTGDRGGESIQTALSTFVDLDYDAPGPKKLELLAGRTAYRDDGAPMWNRSDLPADGFSGVGDFDKNGTPEVILVENGKVHVLDGKTGLDVLPVYTLPGAGEGGPPTIADFDGDGFPEIGVAMQSFYSVIKPRLLDGKTDLLWSHPNHDLSSSVTGSTVFDFEGDGKAEVVYGDECYLWVWGFDDVQKKPVVRFATSSTSFTATEASLVADIDGDGHAELLMVSNRADPSAGGWKCNVKPWNDPDPDAGRPENTPQWVGVPGQPAGTAYRGLTLFGDRANSWVGTRTLWNQHTYHVSNVCDSRDSACTAPNVYGAVPATEQRNWSLPWLNNFRQNVQDTGVFDAPDAVVSLQIECASPVTGKVSIKNQGLKLLPAGVQASVFLGGATGTAVGSVVTTHPLLPGQTEALSFTALSGTSSDVYVARIITDPNAPTFHECRDDNNTSAPVEARCNSTK